MNREGFLEGLARLLADIPENERQEALEFYNNYFDDAGPENEARVIEELGGTPERAAASIRAEFQSDRPQRQPNYGEYTERGYRDTRIPHTDQMPRPVFTQKKKEKDTNNNKTVKIILIALILIVTSGLWSGLLGGVISLVFGLLGGILSLLLGIVAGVFALLVSGVALTVAGIAKCMISPALGLLMSGLGMMLLSVGIILLILAIWMGSKLLPWAMQWSYDILRRFCDWCKSKWKKFR
ncbi:MAG: DUF1700 domain-containing protein [Lachnospiraceae bacterium]|jgi:Predicted membrane protein|nr:DUF1700 domain-containing protein [Lachnospiraceae bacterium]MCI9471331.1 DUF1700 domain-containing protein [Lachnospiraceae bacterium]